jgi:hypothetical protein
MTACGNCTHWRRLVATTADGLPTGRCTWQEGRHGGAHSPLVVQSLLALECSYWRLAGEEAMPGGSEIVEARGQVRASESETPPTQLNDMSGSTLAPMAKAAERESDERWSWWGRLWGQVRRGSAANSRRDADAAGKSVAWEDKLVERSGVGAGTEPCFVCQGRIANLGALAVASPEGDKQTYSVWRCRQCYTYYLNDWIDRWERTDSLETEESYYRLAPQEALEILRVIDGVADAEHPARRHEREDERAWMLQFLGERPKLSHQIKLGR